jgi:hypothetical protein
LRGPRLDLRETDRDIQRAVEQRILVRADRLRAIGRPYAKLAAQVHRVGLRKYAALASTVLNSARPGSFGERHEQWDITIRGANGGCLRMNRIVTAVW